MLHVRFTSHLRRPRSPRPLIRHDGDANRFTWAGCSYSLEDVLSTNQRIALHVIFSDIHNSPELSPSRNCITKLPICCPLCALAVCHCCHCHCNGKEWFVATS